MRDYDLFDDFEYSGDWWLPTSPQHRVSGTLRYKPGDRMTLELLGSLQPDNERSDDLPDSDIILGIVEGSRPCTLQYCIQTRSKSIASGPVYRSWYIVDRLFEGKHFPAPEEISFASLSVSYTSFENWVARVPYQSGHERDQASSKVRFIASHVVPHDLFEARVASLNSTIRARLGFEGSLGIRTLMWKSTGCVEILPDQPASFEWFWKIQNDIRNLFTLFMNNPTYPKRLEAYGNDVETSPGRVAKERINITLVQSSQGTREEIHPTDMLFVFPTIQENTHTILENWLSKSEPLSAVSTLFFGSMYFSSMYPRFHFLNLIQAVETFHRVMRPGTYINKQAFKKISKTLKNAIPADVTGEFKQGLESRISFGNEYSLRTRIKQLFLELEEQTVESITPDVDDFIRQTVNTRNYFTHYTSSLKSKAFNDDVLQWVNDKLRVLLIMLLLKEVGLMEPLIRETICKNKELAYGLSEGGIRSVCDHQSKLTHE